MLVLIQFLFRLAFGLAAAMVATPHKKVSSGFFRVHLQVLLGLNVFVALLCYLQHISVGVAGLAAILSYFGTVMWLYEKPRPGYVLLTLVSAADIIGAWLVTNWESNSPASLQVMQVLDPLSGGMLLGTTIAAMFLGHWYLNSPDMQLGPLRKLIKLIGVALLVRVALASANLAMETSSIGIPNSSQLIFLSLRWLAGMLGLAVVVVMTWKTLKIPNTQSATGLLYVAVLATFLGELVSQLLSSEMVYPV